jgi:ATP-dependent helicase/nuclease subunit A
VHASKGLEAPIVFLPDTANVPRAREMPKLLWEETGLPLYLSRKPQTPAARRAWDQARRMQIEEYRRLFYVALTRAAEQLYICGWEPKRAEGEGVEESWYMLAQKALRPLHETAGLGTDEPVPDIVFADHGLPEKMQEGAPKAPAQKIRLPDWVREPASPEKVTARPLAPSHLAAQAEPPTASPDQLYARGRIIHRLLESLPDVEDAKRDAVAARFLANPQHRLPPKIQKEIAAEVLGLLRNPDYAPLFSPGSQAEVSIAGAYKNNPISGQIDRLCVQKNEIWIIDYKSNRPPPERVENVSLAYFEQLAVYRAVLQSIHPDKQIRCFLLWTYKPLLMPIPNEFLDRV